MNKKIIIILGLFVVGLGIYFALSYKKDNQAGNPIGIYKEPDPGFFDASQVSANEIVVKITDQGFEPATLTIKKGQKVTWINSSGSDTWPASNPHPTHTDYPGFDPGLPLKQNQAWSFVFDKVGDWGYHNHLQPGQRGKLIVQ